MKSAGIVWYLIAILLVFALATYAVIATRRARREQLQRSQERASAMLIAMHEAAAASKAAATRDAGAAAGTVPPPAGAATGAPVPRITAEPVGAASSPAPAVPPAQPVALVRRQRALTEPQRLLFLVLRAALPDHVVMPNLRIIDLLELPNGESSTGDVRLVDLARQRIDFVVCNGALAPLAAIVLHEGGNAAAASDQTRIGALREIGVRYLRFRPDALPKPAEARGLILG